MARTFVTALLCAFVECSPSPHVRVLSHVENTLNTSHPYFIETSAGSRSPDEYIRWSEHTWNCDRGNGDYDVRHCVPSDLIRDSPNFPLPPRSAAWWFLPVPNEPGWYHLVGSVESAQPGMMLDFDYRGNVYPVAYYPQGEDHADEMEHAKVQVVAASHTGASNEELYYLVTGPNSGMVNEMLFLNRDAFGDWLDTWTVRFDDPQAQWRLVPAPCGSAACPLPDFQAAYDRWSAVNVGQIIGYVFAGLVGLWCFWRICCKNDERDGSRSTPAQRVTRQLSGGNFGQLSGIRRAPAADSESGGGGGVPMTTGVVVSAVPVDAQAVPVQAQPVMAVPVQATVVQAVPVQAVPVPQPVGELPRV